MEKLHGTFASVSYNGTEIKFFSGGEPYERFVKLFDQEKLLTAFKAMALPADKTIFILGECYAGSQQKMALTYGKDLKFCAFEVRIGEMWLDIPIAEKIVKDLGLEFVHFVKTTTDLKDLEKQRDEPSVQAIRNGVTTIAPDGSLINPRPREGIVCHPLHEFSSNAGRVIVKFKGDQFRETQTPRKVVDPTQIQKFAEANQIANEYVTETRLQHILQQIPDHGLEKMRDILNLMVADVLREGDGEIVLGDNESAIKKAISSRCAVMYKNYLKGALTNGQV